MCLIKSWECKCQRHLYPINPVGYSTNPVCNSANPEPILFGLQQVASVFLVWFVFQESSKGVLFPVTLQWDAHSNYPHVVYTKTTLK